MRRMRGRSIARLFLIFVALLAAGATRLPAQPVEEDSSCGVCHSEARAAYKESAHAKAGMVCTDCHGGDSTDLRETAMSSRHGFRPAPTRKDVPKMCGSCHADRERMRPYGLPTTQLEEYGTSVHGRRHNQGDMNTAVCTDCHSSGRDKGRHDILPIADSRASVYPNNLPDTCGRCHSDTTKMKPYHIPTDQEALYKSSVHGQALLVGGNRAAPTCVVCHGSHAALPPGVATIDEVCGRCHQGEHDRVKSSVHGGIRDPSGKTFRACLSCHGEPDGGGHGITPPSADSYDVVCVKCHVADKGAALAVTMHTLLADGDKVMEEARQEVERGNNLGFHVTAWDETIKNTLGEVVQARIAQHSLVPGDTEQHTQAIESARDEIRDEVLHRLKNAAVRRMSLVPAWGFILWSMSVLYWKRRRAMRLLHATSHGHEEAAEG